MIGFSELFLYAGAFGLGYFVRELGLIGQLYTFMTTQQGNAVFNTARFVSDIALTFIEQALNKTVTYHANGVCTLRFILNGKLHELKVCPENGPRALLRKPLERGELSLQRYKMLYDPPPTISQS